MKNIFKKIIILLCLTFVLIGFADPVYPVLAKETDYILLAPLPGLNTSFDPTKSSNLGDYLNKIIPLFIGVCAVLAVIMIVFGGIQYMTTELISSKEEGKKRIKNALFGLLLALGAWLILYTINPALLNVDLSSLKDVELINDFQLSRAQTIDGRPGAKINFKKEACPAATAAQRATGVDKAFILAVFSQETGGGSNTGGCFPANANMIADDIPALKTIVGNDKFATTNVSCASGGGHGGAMGLMQFRPTTWLENGGSGKNPWEINDAMLIAASFLKNKGAISDPRNAACKYYSGAACQAGRNPPNEFYGDSVMAKMAQIKAQIAKNGGC